MRMRSLMPIELGEFAGDEHPDGLAFAGEAVDEFVDFQLRANIYAACRFIEENDIEFGQQRLADDALLLVAAGEACRRWSLEGRGLDAEAAEHFAVARDLGIPDR